MHRTAHDPRFTIHASRSTTHDSRLTAHALHSFASTNADRAGISLPTTSRRYNARSLPARSYAIAGASLVGPLLFDGGGESSRRSSSTVSRRTRHASLLRSLAIKPPNLDENPKVAAGSSTRPVATSRVSSGLWPVSSRAVQRKRVTIAASASREPLSLASALSRASKRPGCGSSG